MEPTLLHAEPKLLPGEIVSLIGIPLTLGGKLTAFENFFAEIAASCQSDQTSTKGIQRDIKLTNMPAQHAQKDRISLGRS